ncbi:hypothetical protein KO317_03095 [Candidatus Micrarchaeota archaeon]|nr:hypothetical protein [Candidatus Micrarchaeota archaeon]
MKYIYILISMCLLLLPIFANSIYIQATQPNGSNTIEYTINIFDEYNNSETTEVMIYYKHNNKIINSEKEIIYGKTIKKFKISEIGNYSIYVADQKTKGVFSSNIEITNLPLPKELEEKTKNIEIFDKTQLLIIIGIITVIIFIFLYKFYTAPKKKKY